MIAPVCDVYREELAEETAEQQSPVEQISAPSSSKEALVELESLETSLAKAKMQLKAAKRTQLGYLIAGIVFLALNGMLVFVASVALLVDALHRSQLFRLLFPFCRVGNAKGCH